MKKLHPIFIEVVADCRLQQLWVMFREKTAVCFHKRKALDILSRKTHEKILKSNRIASKPLSESDIREPSYQVKVTNRYKHFLAVGFSFKSNTTVTKDKLRTRLNLMKQ